jgi:hypothetical protein
MSSESWQAVGNWRPAVIQPTAEQLAQVPGLNLPAASADQIQATDAVLSERDDPALAGAVGFWSAGMLLHELQASAKKDEKDDEDEVEEKEDPKEKKQPWKKTGKESWKEEPEKEPWKKDDDKSTEKEEE